MSDFEELTLLKAEVVESMVSYMTDEDDPDFDAGYEQEHVDRCASILDGFIASISSISPPGDSAQILTVTKNTVLALNALNDSCDGSLIETDQREMICALILTGARLAGLPGEDDITEEWREW